MSEHQDNEKSPERVDGASQGAAGSQGPGGAAGELPIADLDKVSGGWEKPIEPGKAMCSRCSGTGRCYNCSGTGQTVTYTACYMCGGTGRCYYCSGNGFT